MVNIIVQTEYKDLFNGPTPSLDEVIPQEVNIDVLILLSLMSHMEDYTSIAQWCARKLSLSKTQRDHCLKSRLFKRPSNLMVWEKLLKRKVRISDNRSFDNAMSTVVKALAAANDFEVENINNSFFMSEIVHFYLDNPLMQYFRASRMLFNCGFIAADLKDFEDATQVSISEYIKTCHCLNNMYIHQSKAPWPVIAKNWIIDVELLAPQIGLPIKTMDKVMTLLALEYGESYVESYDYQIFSEKPYIKVGPYRYFPIDRKLAQDALFNSFYNLLRRSVSDEVGFRSRYGFEFEKYVAELAKMPESSPNKFGYSHLPEFTFASSERKSSDAYITYFDQENQRKITLVIEAKAARVMPGVRRTGSTIAVQKSLQKLATTPFRQQVRRTIDIIRERASNSITIDHVYYFLVVTSDNFPLTLGAENLKFDIDGLEELQFGGVFSMGIEEYELFIKLLCSNIDSSFARILEEHRVDHADESLKNYISRLLKKYQSPEFDEVILNSQSILF